MNALSTALLAALEAIVAAAVGIGIVLVPMTLLWGVEFGLQLDYEVFWRAAGLVWLLGHGVDVVAQLDPVTAASLGVPGAGDPFVVTIALLGFAVLAFAFGRRIGVRSARAGHPFVGGTAAVLVFAGIATLVTLTVDSPPAAPDRWQGVILPALVLAGGVLVGAIVESLRLDVLEADRQGPLARRIAALPHPLLDGTRLAVRGGVAAAAGVLGAAALLVAVLIVLDYATIAGLYQSLQSGVVGGLALTIGELAVLPNVVVWAASWLLGPGFALGAGSAVSPSGTLLGPVPGLPLLGALPSSGGFGLLGLLVPVVLGFLAGRLAGGSGSDASRRGPWWAAPVRGVVVGVVAATILGLLAWWSSGAAGPGRLAEVGPDWLPVALLALAAIGVPAVLGALLGAREPHPVDHVLDDGRASAGALVEPSPPGQADGASDPILPADRAPDRAEHRGNADPGEPASPWWLRPPGGGTG